MLQEFAEHIENYFPNLRNERFLLACSGGVDSVALAHLCEKIGLDFAMAHCNFQLRGAESDGDELLVGQFAKELNRNFFITRFNTIGYINKNKLSLQVGARQLRYRWFDKIMRENDIGILVTAHHADDDLETFLINLSRGTGIDGLTGIPKKTNTIARPLLSFSRDKILQYAKAQKLDWREDSSNADTKYLRNKIRHEIVPNLKRLHPTFLENFQKTQAYLGQTAEIVEGHIEQTRKKLFKIENDVYKISVASLVELQPIEAYFYAIFKPYGFHEWKDALGLLTAMSGKEVRSNTHRLIRDRDFLLLTELKQIGRKTYTILEDQRRVNVPLDIHVTLVTSMSEMAPNILYVDKNSLKYPLTIRKWEKGDYFYPLGMKGKKKLSKFFKDEKVDVLNKEKQWLLCSGNDIVWVIGRRADERYRVTKKTKKIVSFVLNK